MIKTAEVIEENAAGDEIGVNDTVKVLFVDEGEEDTYTIVSTMRGDSLHNLVSIESPIGKALLGHKVGDTINVEVNKDVSYPLKVLEIRKDNEGESAKLRGF